MTEQQDNHSNNDNEDPRLETIKGNKARGTWALILLIFVVFAIARWVMQATAS